MSEIFEPSLTQDMIDYMKIKATYDPARLDGIDASLAQKANQSDIGTLASLTTADKTNIVNAINSNAKNVTGWVNVVALGADSTGTNDCTSIIQSALNNSTYKVIYFPAGTYKVTNLSLTRSGTVLIGDSYWNTIIQSTATSGDLIYLNNNGAWRSQIRNLKLVGTGTGTLNGVRIDTTANVTSEFTMDFVQILSCGGTGIYVPTINGNALYHSNFLNLYLDSNGTDADITLNDGFIANSYFYGAQQTGLKLTGNNCKINNIKCAVNGQQNSGAGGYGLWVLGARNTYVNVDAQQNCGIGIYFDDGAVQNIIRNAIIDGNGCTSSTQTGNSALLYEGLSMGGIDNEVYGMVADYYGSYQVRGYIRRYYSQKGCIVNVSDTTNKGKSLPILDATPIPYIMKKASDLPATIAQNGTPATSYSFGNVTYGSNTVGTLNLPIDNKLSFDVTKFIDRTFNFSFLMKVNFGGDTLQSVDFATIGSFFKLSFQNKVITAYINNGANGTYALGSAVSNGDIYSVSINGVCTGTNTYKIYMYIYKWNGTSFVSVATTNATYDFTSQSSFSNTIGFYSTATGAAGLTLNVWNASTGAPYINADQITYVTNQQLNSNHAIYLPLSNNLNPQTIV